MMDDWDGYYDGLEASERKAAVDVLCENTQETYGKESNPSTGGASLFQDWYVTDHGDGSIDLTPNHAPGFVLSNTFEGVRVTNGPVLNLAAHSLATAEQALAEAERESRRLRRALEQLELEQSRVVVTSDRRGYYQDRECDRCNAHPDWNGGREGPHYGGCVFMVLHRGRKTCSGCSHNDGMPMRFYSDPCVDCWVGGVPTKRESATEGASHAD
jgi:hypothetical protein